MHLHAAFVPPAETAHALARLVAAHEPAGVTAPAPPAPPPRRGPFGRRQEGERPAEPPATPGPMLDVLDPVRMVVPITDFGFLAAGDARRLVDALVPVCAALPAAPAVRVSGGAALVDPDDRAVWADLAASEDDLGAMRSIAEAVVAGVQPLGFFCDRRQYRPRFPIATITDRTTVEHLEAVLAALAAFESDPWTVGEVAIMQRGSGTWRTVTVGR